MIYFPCPSCGETMKVSDEVAGKAEKCKCGELVRVPTPNPLSERWRSGAAEGDSLSRLRIAAPVPAIYGQEPSPAVPPRQPRAGRGTMLVRCPACKKQFSETADACPKCGFKVDPQQSASLRAQAIRQNRIGLLIAATLLLLVSTPCLLTSLFE